MGKAIILTQTEGGIRACASAARISTAGGGAIAQFHLPLNDKKDVALVRKVLASGHHSVFEHQTFFVGFEDVSVAVEQFVIESRLGSYTVKSRRYVDFSGAGYYTPENLPDPAAYTRCMDGLFALYGQLLDAGVAREDARFVLPYCFCSNFYMTMNARELTRLVCQMTSGRGKAFAELRELGQSLISQIEERYPGAVELMQSTFLSPDDEFEGIPTVTPAQEWHNAKPDVTLTQAEPNAMQTLQTALAFTGRRDISIARLTADARPRELEFLRYGFMANDVSLAGTTHFARHRMQSILIPDVRTALATGSYITPQSVAELADTDLQKAYQNAFRSAAECCKQQLQNGMDPANTAYFALAGMTMPLFFSMNARELALFLRLRTCERAQWEIRALARKMLALLRENAPEVFGSFGPSCKVLGRCPEGRLSCGHPPEL